MLVIKNKKIKSKFFLWQNNYLKKFIKNKKNFLLKASFLIIIFPPFLIGSKPIATKIFKIIPEKQQNEIKGIIADSYLDEILNEKWKSPFYTWPLNYTRGLISNPENIEINIKYENFNNISKERENALLQGSLIQNSNSSQKAFIKFKNKIYPAKIRLKGDLKDHYEGINQWSFRVRLLEDKSIYGMKKFSLHVPKVRNYLGDSIYHRFLKKEDLPFLRNKVASVKLNGRDLGTYTIEEHFDKYLIENNNLREGIILGLNESVWWGGQSKNYLKNTISLNEDFHLNWGIRVFDRKRIKNDENLKSQYIYASELLRNYLNGSLKASEVFELEKTAKFLALNDLLAAEHGLRWLNLRFLYNPFTKKLIPIGFDANATGRISTLVNNTGSLSRIFEDQLLQSRYLWHLNRISKTNYLDEFIKENLEEINSEVAMLHRTYPWTFRSKEYFENLKYNQKIIRERINPKFNIIDANFNSLPDNNLGASFINKSYFPLEILGISNGKEIVFLPSEKIIVPVSTNKKNVINENYTLIGKYNNPPLENNYKDLRVIYRISGINKDRSEFIDNLSITKSNFNFDSIAKSKPNIGEFNFLDVDDANKLIKFKDGYWVINKPLIIPKDYKLSANPNVDILLSDEGIILSRGPIEFVGNKEKYITITSKNNGKGIVVLSAKSKSLISFVKFENLSFPSEKAWNITGALTFYESPVKIENSFFNDNISEDFLNIVRANFEINNTTFSNTKSDALDVDFGEGKLNNVNFLNIGNDAVDISGSYLRGENINIDGSGDKAISVGERSKMFLDNLTIKNSAIGIASKDLSFFEGNNVTIESTKLGFTAFQKKDEYGPGSIVIKNLFENNWSNDNNENKLKFYLLEPSSVLNINGYPFKYNVSKVKEYLYGNLYGKSSK